MMRILAWLLLICSGCGAQRVVKACAGTVGTWQEITPPEVSLDANAKTGAGQNYGTNSFLLDPNDTATVYLGTSAQGIFKSGDCGATWVHINTGTNGAMLDMGRQWTMAIDPIDSKVLYANAGYGPNGIFKSVDGGVDWEQILTPDALSALIFGGFVERLNMDPTNHLHLIVTPHFTCQGTHSMSCILETEDGGTSWRVIENAPPAQEGTGQMMVDSKTWFWAIGFGGLWRTADQGASWTNVANTMGYAYDQMYRAPDGTFYVAAAFNIIKSSDGINWTTIDKSPGANSLAGSATTLYASHGACVAPGMPYQPFYSAPLSDPTHWTQIDSPPMITAGSLQYDNDHHMLYSSACLAGFWRVVTE